MTLRRSDGLRRKTEAEISASDRARAAHTGTQAIATVEGLSDGLDALEGAAAEALASAGSRALASAVGITGSATNLGPFTSPLIDDNQTVKAAIESIGTNLAASSGALRVGSDDGASGSLWTNMAGFISYLRSSVGSAIIGFVASGTGATSRTLQAKLREMVSVKDFGAVGDGSTTTDGVNIQKALDAVGAAGGGFVFVPRGTYLSTVMLEVPNRVHLMGEHYSCTTIRATSTFNAQALIANKQRDGTQQYASISNIGFDGNRGNGAVCSVAVVWVVSVFEGSVFDQVIATEGSNVGFKVEIANGFGPVEFGSLWCLSNTNKNFFCEVTGTGNAGNGINIANLTAEHQDSGGVSVEFKNTTASNILVGVRIENIHIEQRNSGAGTKCIRLDGVTNFTADKIELLCGSPSSHTGIEITNNIFNQFIELRQVTNANLINPILSDLQNSVTYGAVPFPYYATPDVGVFREGEQTLTYSSSITPNLALGNYCIIVVTDGNPITINPPTNGRDKKDMYFEIVNASGGAMGTITWNGTAYPYVSWTNPANGKRRFIHLHRRSATAWAQVGAVTPDL